MIYIVPFLAIIIGYLIALKIEPKNKKTIKLLLAFSGSFLLSLTVTHLLPVVFDGSENNLHQHGDHVHIFSVMGIYIMVGVIFQIILEYFSRGAEHGHVHGKDSIQSIPWSLFVSLCLHALLEGLPISKQNSLAWGIAVHHLPIAIILTTFFNQTKLSKISIFIFMITFAIMTPFGTFIAANLSFLQVYYKEISAFVIGILFHISSTIIFESSENHKFNLSKISAIIGGVILSCFM
jgi:hypothetical protein